MRIVRYKAQTAVHSWGIGHMWRWGDDAAYDGNDTNIKTRDSTRLGAVGHQILQQSPHHNDTSLPTQLLVPLPPSQTVRQEIDGGTVLPGPVHMNNRIEASAPATDYYEV